MRKSISKQCREELSVAALKGQNAAQIGNSNSSLNPEPYLWFRESDDWPQGFEDLGSTQPENLWRWGPLKIQGSRVMAIVGSRRASVLGLARAREAGLQLSQAGISVISGLARGIDAAALRGALKGDVPPVAIIGNGFPKIYPPENQLLAHEIVEAGGAILSEYPPGTPPRGFHFPQRNRLISAWSEAVVVIEATKKSGSLGTAHRAQEMGREVLAYPGAVERGQHTGCHALIREGAVLVESVESILEWVNGHRDLHVRTVEERRLKRLWKLCGLDERFSEPSGAGDLATLQKQTGWSAAFLLQVWWSWQERHRFGKEQDLNQGQM